MSALGCGAVELDGADEVVDEARDTGEQFFAVRRDTRRCASPMCGGFWLSRVGASSTLCGDGRRLPECYVPELTVSGLSESQLDLVRSSAHGMARRVFLRGRLEASRARATQAWVAPSTAASMTNTLRLAYRPTCESHQRCASAVSMALSNGRTTVLSSVDFTVASGSASEIAAASHAATTSIGVITQGTLASTARGQVLRVSDFATPVLAESAALCGVELQHSLAALTEALTFPSESDYPFEFVERPGGGALTTESFRAAFGVPSRERIEVRSLDDVFRWIAAERPDMSDEERALARRYAALREALRANLQDVQAFRFGAVQVQVYLIGRTRCEAFAGLKTVSIET